MGRRSLEATKLRCIWWARAAVTFLRGCECDVVFFAQSWLDLCALVEDEDFFLCVWWCCPARAGPLLDHISKQARKTNKAAHGYSLASV